MSPPTPDALRALAEWAAALERPGFSMGSWVISEPDENGVTHMPWFRYGPDAEALHATLGRYGWIEVFAWPAWLETPRGRALAGDRDALATATPEELRKLLTAIVRSDRFNEGSFAGAYESGLLLAIARRAGELAEGS